MDALEDLLAYLGTASDMLVKVEEASGLAKNANSALNDAVGAGNKSSYSAMKTKAKAAQADYAKAAVLFRAAHELDPTAELNKAADYCDKRKAQADVVVRMADEGKSGKTSAYNEDVKKMNRLGDEAMKIGEPAIVTDPQWAEKRLAALTTLLDEQGAKADELHKKALVGLGFSTQ